MNEPTKDRAERPEEQQSTTPISQSTQLEGQQLDGDVAAQESEKRRRDGYRETEGAAYGDSRSGYGVPDGGLDPAEKDYNPAHSGVQPAKHKPGETIDAPGRDTGTAWGEKKQMGMTDLPDRNPAG